MWTCPKCGREFKRVNQGHYCGTAPKTVAEYIAALPEDAQPHASEMANLLQNCAPDVQSRIAWSMPYYERAGKSISFSANKGYLSLYAGPEAIDAFKDQLQECETKKSAIYFPFEKPLPVELITAIARWCLGWCFGESS